MLPGQHIPRNRFVWLLMAVLLLLSLANAGRMVLQPINADRPIDFRPLYMAAALLSEGKNPYSEIHHKEKWQQIIDKENIPSGYIPKLPLSRVIYPPPALTLMLPFTLLPYQVAYPLWYFLLGLFFIGIIWLVTRLYMQNNAVAFLLLLLWALAFKGTIASLLVGQPTYLCLLCGFGALYFKKTSPVLSGILLGISGFKITLALPFILFFVIRHYWKVVGIAFTTGLLLSLPALFLAEDILALTISYLENVSELRDFFFSAALPEYPLNYVMISSTEFTALAEFFVQGANKWFTYINLAILAIGFAALYMINHKRKLAEHYLFIMISLLVLLTTYHLFYDCLLLLPLIPYALTLERKWQALLILAAVPLFLPINGFLDALQVPPNLYFLYFTLPVSLLCILAIVVAKPVTERENVMD